MLFWRTPAATRNSAHKLGRPVDTWSTTRHHNAKSQLLSVLIFFARSPSVGAVSGLGLLTAPLLNP